MKKILLFLSLFHFVSCNSLINFFKKNSSLNSASTADHTSSEPDKVHVYFEEPEEWLGLVSLNQESQSLKLFDHIVFSDKEHFLIHKAENPELGWTQKKSPPVFRVNSFCDSSPAELKKQTEAYEFWPEELSSSDPKTANPSLNEPNTETALSGTNKSTAQSRGRENYQLESDTVPSHISVVNIIPAGFLVKNLDQPFYCTFLFQFDSKNHLLIQQEIDPSPSDKQSLFGLSLLQQTESGKIAWDKETPLTKKNISLISFADSTGQQPEQYDLYCEGNKISSVSSAVSSDLIISKLLQGEGDNLPKEGQPSCRILSQKQKQILGISPAFLINFEDLSRVEEKSFPEVLPNDGVRVYFEESKELLELVSLNQESQSLKLFDHIVFSDKEHFLAHKSENFNLSPCPVDEPPEKSPPAFKINSLCDSSPSQLQNKEELYNFLPTKADTNSKREEQQLSSSASNTKAPPLDEPNTGRENYQLESDAIPSHVFVANIIPESVLVKNLNQPFYCTFLFQFNSKTHLLIQQEIDPSPSDKQSLFGLSLLQQTESGKTTWDKETPLTKKSLNLLSLADSTGQQPQQYDLYCEGNKISSVSSAVSSEVLLSKMLEGETLPKTGQLSCRILSKKQQQILGISPEFLIDFEDLSRVKPTIDLSKLSAPHFRLREGLAGYVEFPNLEDFVDQANYESIAINSQTECLHISKDFETINDSVLTKTSKQPLQKQIAVMSITPESAFMSLSRNYDHWLYRDNLLDQEESKKKKDIGKNSEKLEYGAHWWRREHNILEQRWNLEDHISGMQEDLDEERSQLLCIYKIQLEDQNRPSNKIAFEPQFEIIKWKKNKSQGAYGLGVVALNTKHSPFLSNKDLDKQHKEALRQLPYRDRLLFQPLLYQNLLNIDDLKSQDYSLQVQFFDQDNSAKSLDIHRVALKCYKESFNDSQPFSESLKEDSLVIKTRYWDKDELPDPHFVSLSSLLLDPEIKEFSKNANRGETVLLVCRVLFYSQYKGAYFLRYFSPEMRFRN